jgi:hypothetical protein
VKVCNDEAETVVVVKTKEFRREGGKCKEIVIKIKCGPQRENKTTTGPRAPVHLTFDL